MFMLLASGLVAQTARRTVVGMLAATGMAAIVSFHTCCRFFSPSLGHRSARARLGVADRVAAAGRARGDQVVIDDTLFRRWGRKVHAAFWTHDGAAQDPNALGPRQPVGDRRHRGRLPFCCHPVSLPVLLRLWAGKGTASPVELAGELIMLLAKEFPDRRIHAVGDAAYHGKPLLVAGATITTRLPANAALYAPAPPHTGRRGRPGEGRPARHTRRDRRHCTWRTVTVARYGAADTVAVAVLDGIWYGAFGNQLGRIVLVRGPGERQDPGTVHHRPRQHGRDHRGPLRAPLDDRNRHRCRQAIARDRPGPQPAPARGRTHRALRVRASTASSSSGTPCTATTPTTSTPAARASPGTGTRASRPSKTCWPSSAEPLSPPEFPAVTAEQPDPALIPRLRTGLRLTTARAYRPLGEPDAGTKLTKALATVRSSGPLSAYKAMSSGGSLKIKFLDTSFFTKFLYFGGWDAKKHMPEPLIYDQHVARALRHLTTEEEWVNALPSERYGEYLDLVAWWAAELGTSEDVVERRLFHVGQGLK